MKRLLLTLCIFAFTLNPTAQARTYKMATLPWVGYSPANVAEVKGFWKEAGIDVRVFNLHTLQAIDEALQNKTVDWAFGITGGEVELYAKGVPLKILAEIDWSYGGDKIVVKNNFDPNTLKTKPIGIYQAGPSLSFFLDHYLSTLGVKLSETTLNETELDVLTQNFIQGVFEVIVTYDPYALQAEREGNGKVAATSRDYPGVITDSIMILDEAVKDIPRQDLVNFFKGWLKAEAWIRDPANWKEYMEILNTYTFAGEGPYSEEDLRDMTASVKILDPALLRERNQPNGGLSQYLQELKAFLQTNEQLQKEFTAEAILDTSALLEALDQAQ